MDNNKLTQLDNILKVMKEENILLEIEISENNETIITPKEPMTSFRFMEIIELCKDRNLVSLISNKVIMKDGNCNVYNNDEIIHTTSIKFRTIAFYSSDNYEHKPLIVVH